MAKKKQKYERGEIIAMNDFGDFWFYGGDLTREELSWPTHDLEPNPGDDLRFENVNVRWGIDNTGEFGRILYITDKITQGTFKATHVYCI